MCCSVCGAAYQLSGVPAEAVCEAWYPPPPNNNSPKCFTPCGVHLGSIISRMLPSPEGESNRLVEVPADEALVSLVLGGYNKVQRSNTMICWNHAINQANHGTRLLDVSPNKHLIAEWLSSSVHVATIMTNIGTLSCKRNF